MKTKIRPLHKRVWAAYCGYRKNRSAWQSVKGAVALEWLFTRARWS